MISFSQGYGHGEGERRKNAAHQLYERQRKRFIRDARRAMLEAVLVKGSMTIDDVRAVVELPEGVHPKAFGAVPGCLARAGIIRQDGFAKTSRPEAHARHVAVWRLADPHKAEAWLAAHRPLPPLTTGQQLTLPFEKRKTPTAASAKTSTAGATDGSIPQPKTNQDKESNHG